MANFTTNFNLKKPLGGEVYNIEDDNGNMDLLDTALTNKAPLASPTFTGTVTAPTNTSYTTRQVRNVVLSTADASGGSNGDIWFKYTP